MNETTKCSTETSAAITKSLMFLCSNFRVDVTPVLEAVWQEGLAELTVPQIRQATMVAIRTLKFFPRIAEMLEFAGVSAPPSPKPVAIDEGLLEAEQTWLAIERHIDRVGEILYPSDPKLELSPAGEYALAQIGGRGGYLAAQGKNTLNFVHRDFVERYRMFAVTGGLQALPQDKARYLLKEVNKLAMEAGHGRYPMEARR